MRGGEYERQQHRERATTTVLTERLAVDDERPALAISGFVVPDELPRILERERGLSPRIGGRQAILSAHHHSTRMYVGDPFKTQVSPTLILELWEMCQAGTSMVVVPK